MESLLQMKGTYIVHFMETLSANGVPDHLVLRYRMDRRFAEKISKLIIAEHLENPGKKFVIEVDRSLSRGQLNDMLRHQRVLQTLRNDIVEALEPKTTFCGLNQLEKMEFFLVSLHRETDEVKATSILNDMRLESVTTEEALTFVLQSTGGFSRDYSIVILSAKYAEPKKVFKNNFLEFGISVGGDFLVNLTHYDFGPGTMFLVKKKKPQSEKQE